MRAPLFLIAITCTLTACTWGNKQSISSMPVDMPASLFSDRDSVLYYAERAYLQNDPKGCFVVGACYYLNERGELPDYIYTVDQAQADTFLMISAAQKYTPAIELIHYLVNDGSWQHDF